MLRQRENCSSALRAANQGVLERLPATHNQGFATSIDLQTLTFETKMQLSKQASGLQPETPLAE